jgi:uncharacterized protein involved in outer membrane biogenesis
MKKLFYILLILLLALLAAPYFIPLNTYKPFIASLVSKQTGLLLAIDGPIKLNLFPTIHVSIHDVHLKRPQGESMKELLTAKSLAVQMELWPLLRKEVNIKEILADHPHPAHRCERRSVFQGPIQNKNGGNRKCRGRSAGAKKASGQGTASAFYFATRHIKHRNREWQPTLRINQFRKYQAAYCANKAL